MLKSAFPEKITPHYRSLFTKTEEDPLKKMVCYSPLEEISTAEESDDPIGDGLFRKGRLVHRHPNRALLLVTDRCAAHCRFCFRKGGMAQGDITDGEIQHAVEYLRNNDAIEEVILSGGDPLALSNQRLLVIIRELKKTREGITIRIHTRYPVYEPSRCAEIAAIARHVAVFVLHINHPRELTPELAQVLPLLVGHCTVFNQSVLLQGINDSATTLAELSSRLFALGVIPYYLHVLDRARGSSHFVVPHEEAIKLFTELSQNLAGYLVPRMVIDGGETGKRHLWEHLSRG
ncbi:MAG: radical SAM protein [Deltaproteobacteria bacterium]|nr:radical SAM protein [Deltaproteobacteria bacterium]